MLPVLRPHPIRLFVGVALAFAAFVLAGCATQTLPPSSEAPPSPPQAHSAGAESAGPSGESVSEETAGDENFKNTIRWSTASEVENAGFNVYRGDTADGPFERLNDDLIEGAYTTDEPQYYTFVDSSIDPYASYFYYVESVSLAGVRENFTPVIAAKPKLPKDSE